MTAKQPPVTDWLTDFDHASREYAQNAPRVWEEIRSSGCPVAHTERYGGAWLPTTYADVKAIAYDTEHFTSRAVVVSNARPGPDDLPAPIGGAPPITDPPFHQDARRILLPAFAPKKIAALEDRARALCNELLDELGDADVFDAATAYAAHIPPSIIAQMLGFPDEDREYFLEIVAKILEEIDVPAEERRDGGLELDGYFDRQIADHIENPRDDLTSHLLNAELFGDKLDMRIVRGTMVLILVAGIDTTWSGIGASIYHLASHPEDLARLVAEPELIDTAVEEFLRAYAPVTMARMVAKPVEISGCPMNVDDWVLLPFPSANLDPAQFEDPNTVKIDRLENRHSAFGLGIHRCVGSNLARLEMKVAIEEFVKRYPKFELADADNVMWSGGQVRGPREMGIRVLERGEVSA
jgi:cytochrome P450